MLYPIACPPRLILYKMLTLSSLAFAAMLPLSPAARAGSWTFTCNGSGSNDDVSAVPGQPDHHTPWTSPGPQTGSFSLPQFGSSSSYRSKNTVSVTVTVKATWNPGPSNDPAPPAVWLCESASAEWSAGSSGSASDGLGPEYKLNPSGGGIASSADAPASTPPAYWKKYAVSGGSVTLPGRTLKAEADFPPTTSWPYGNTCAAFVDSYKVTIHAQPYGWYNAGWSANGTDPDNTTPWNSANGTLSFRYKWYSTDGNLAHLAGIDIYEYVDYTGNSGRFTNHAPPNYYYPTNPPIGDTQMQGGGTIGFHVENPEISHVTPTYGFAQDGHSPWPTKTPLSVFNCVAPQKYKFDDAATGQVGVVLYDAGSITDAVQLNPNQFYVGKSGGSATTPL